MISFINSRGKGEREKKKKLTSFNQYSINLSFSYISRQILTKDVKRELNLISGNIRIMMHACTDRQTDIW